jgi:hypothetical protein
LASLLHFWQVETDQTEIAKAAGVQDRILADGTRPFELAQAAQKLAPHLKYWFKQPTSFEEVAQLLNERGWPVVINWQGLFHPSVEAEGGLDQSGDNGHYSLVVGIDLVTRTISLVDPYPDFAGQVRTFSLDWFASRWWDVARDIDPLTQQAKVFRTHHFIFILCPIEDDFPSSLGMQPAEELAKLYVVEAAESQAGT